MSKPIERHPQFALKPLALAIALAAGTVLPVPKALAQLPTGGAVAHGNVTFTNPNANTLNINQATPKAVIDWQSFNVGAGNTVNFNQPGATAAALNRIHQMDPSVIAGALNANGRVYLVNQNGIIFNGTARVNTGGLLASSLEIKEDQFVNSSIFAAIRDGKPALESERTDGLPAGDIRIDAGAHIKTASGGSVLIFAPNITNDGKIETPDGQTLMAAAKDKVYLMVSDKDDDYRGLIVEVGIGGKVTNANLGEIIAERGNVTLLGMAVNQQGKIKATTAVDLNGTVRLLARDGAEFKVGGGSSSARGFDVPEEAPSSDTVGAAIATNAGEVILGAGSDIDISPDRNGKTAPNLQKQNPSKVEIMGKTVVMEKDSRIVAPAGEVIITATATPGDLFIPSSQSQNQARSDARFLMEQGSVIDVSGVEGVELEMSRNVLEVELRGNELKDSPLQRDGILRGKKVKVDLRRGEDIAIADISAAVDAIQRGADERMTTGGSIQLNSTGDVVQKQGALLDISGGSVKYKAGVIESTKLISDGIAYDISEADPNRIYDGIVGHNTRLHRKWNLTETYVGMNTQNGGVWVDAYTDGRDAGSIGIESHRLLLEGDVVAHVIDGIEQRDIADRAVGGALNIALRRSLDDVQEVRITDDMIYHDVAKDDVLVDVLLETEATESSEGELPAGKTVLIDGDGDGIGELLLSDDMLSRSGLSRLSLSSMDNVTVEQGASVQLRDGASLSLEGSNVIHSGSITAHGGNVDMLAIRAGVDVKDGKHFDVTLTDSASIDVSGRFTNDYVLGPDVKPTDLVAVDAGKVTLKARGTLTLAAGSAIDADGAAFISQQGELRAGKGGDISLTTAVEDGADMILDGSLSAYALEQGGTLSIEAASVAIGNNPDLESVASGNVLHLDNAFFSEGGFSAFDITANTESMHVDGTANLQLAPRNYVYDPATFLNKSTGVDIPSFAAIDVLPARQQNPTALSLTLKQSQLTFDETGITPVTAPIPGRFAINVGAEIATNAGGEITLSSDNSLFIDGRLQADGGSISATVVPHRHALRGYDSAQSLWLGSNAQLISNAAWIEGEPHPNGLRTGHMLDAGIIHLEAQRGILAIEQGASVEASGTLQHYDAVVTVNGQSSVRELTAEGAAGAIELLTAEGMFIDGDLKMVRASESATGGRLLAGFSLQERTLNASSSDIHQFPSNSPVIRITSGDGSSLQNLEFGGSLTREDSRLGAVVLDAETLSDLDLDVLTLDARNRDYYLQNQGNSVAAGRIEFSDAASVQTKRELNLQSESLRVGDDSLITLQSAVVRVGIDKALRANWRESTTSDPLVRGRGALVLKGDLVDLVGDIGVDNVAELSLVSSGDIRVRSNPSIDEGGFEANRLQTAGDINLLAQQIYPNTLADYTIASTAENGRITVARADGDARAPLSAAGKITLLADEIEQGGVIRAPLGDIVLGDDNTSSLNLAAGSVTSVSAAGLEIPLGRIVGEDVLWNYNGGAQMRIDSSRLPQKTVALNGDAVDLQQGAVVDLSGGGDIYATEFITGPGGSIDVLDGANAGDSFAIVPTLGNAYAPYDLNESRGTDIVAGQTLHLEQDVLLANGTRLAAGDYTVLPARYALQTGAVLVTPLAVDNQIMPGQQFSRLDGAAVAAGKYAFANTDITDANWSAFTFEPGTVALTRSAYVRRTATEFFTGENALLTMPADAGQLAIRAGSALNLDASLVSASADTARGARVDIAADNLLVASDSSIEVENTVVIDAADINALDADSILLGGIRSRTPVEIDGSDESTLVTTLDVASTSVAVQDGVRLQGSEFFMAATDNVSVGANAQIAATAPTPSTTVEQIHIDGDGALLQVSGLQRAQIMRDNETGGAGDLQLGAGSLLQASRSVVLDASHDMSINDVSIDSAGLTLSASRIVLGDVADAGSTNGAVLNTALLAQLNPRDLLLHSRSDISIASDVTVQAHDLGLQAGMISANGHNASFNAVNRLTLQGNASSAAAGETGGALHFAGAYLQLGTAQQDSVAQAQMVLDADSVSVIASQGVLLSDSLAVKVDGDIAVAAPHVTALDAAESSIDAVGNIDITSAGEANQFLLAISAIGASLQLSGDAVNIDTLFKLPTAALEVNAREGNITLNDKARMELAGVVQQFGDQQVASGGGTVNLTATRGDNLVAEEAGNISLAAGSVLDVSGATLEKKAGNGDPVSTVVSGGGAIGLNAALGAVALNGELKAQGDVAGEGGSLAIDARTLGESDALFAKLATAGFDRKFAIRQREGNIDIAAGRTLKAHEIHLAADTGDVTVAGKLDATGAKGGAVTITAGFDAVLANGATIDARALAADGRGGKVSIGAGAVDVEDSDPVRVDGNLTLQEGAVINVSGGDNSATNHGINSIRQGEVHLRARRNDDHSLNVAGLNATVQGADRVELEAFDSMTAAVIDAAIWGEIKDNVDQFMASVTTDFINGLGSLAAGANFHLLPGIVVSSDEDMTVTAAVDLSTWRYTVGDKSEPGVLTLRAAGDLNINATISDGYFSDPNSDELWAYFSSAKALSSGHSWHYNLVAGADVSAAAVDATRSGQGDYVQAADVIVRTGTGDIRVAAGNDVRFESETSALYTGGRTALYRYATPSSWVGIEGFVFDEFGNYVSVGLVGESYDLAYTGAVYPLLLGGLSDMVGFLPERIMFGYDGGDITISAGNDIDMPETRQMSSDWLQRYYGNVEDNSFGQLEAILLNTWGVVASDFQQGIATLGGGDIAINAGGDITNLSASIPVTLRQNRITEVNSAGNPAPVTGEIIASDDIYMWERNGGGDLTVNAGGDILSPQLLADLGSLSLDAGGSIGAVAGRNQTVLSVSDTAVAIQARGDIGIEAIFNTTVMPQSTMQYFAEGDATSYGQYFSVFFSYADDTRVDINSTVGDIVFDNSFGLVGRKLELKLEDEQTWRYSYSGLSILTDDNNDASTLLRILPSTVTATAQSGDILLDGDVILFPSSQGQLELLAKNNISKSKSDRSVVVISDADPQALSNLMADPTMPFALYRDYLNYNQEPVVLVPLNTYKHARNPVHEGDSTAALMIAASGDIDGKSTLGIISAKKMRAFAGDDIREISFDLQHANSSDSSELRAGGDIDQGFNLISVGSLAQNIMGVQISGPGRLDVIAGGEVNLGSSNGVVSLGNQQNTALPENGADIMLMSGAGSFDPSAVATRYLPYSGSDGAARLIDLAATEGELLQSLLTNPQDFGLELPNVITVSNPQEAQVAYQTLSAEQQLQVALKVLGSDKSSNDSRDYTAALVDFVLSDQFAGDALALASQITQQAFTSKTQLIEFFAAQNRQQNSDLAQTMFAQLDAIDQRSLVYDIVYDEVRKGGLESLKQLVVDPQTQGFQRGYNAIETLFPDVDQNDADLADANADIGLIFSNVTSRSGGDVNFLTPRGGIDVGLAGAFAGLQKGPGELGLLVQSTGDIRGVSYGDININASRIFALDGGDIMLWSSQNDIDAGKGAKTALAISSPRVKYNSDGEVIGLDLPASVSGSGIQAAIYTANRTPGGVYLFAPQGVIDAGEAGISSAGDLFLAATEVLGADNITFGGVSIGVPTTTGISASLSSAGDAASASTAAAVDDTAGSASGDCDTDEDCEDNNSVAFVTVEIIGLGD